MTEIKDAIVSKSGDLPWASEYNPEDKFLNVMDGRGEYLFSVTPSDRITEELLTKAIDAVNQQSLVKRLILVATRLYECEYCHRPSTISNDRCWENLKTALATLLRHRQEFRDKPTVVCICGSTRFYDVWQQTIYAEAMAGRITLQVGFYPHSIDQTHGGEVGCTPTQKIALDELHLRKIDLADEIFVLNVGGYVGESTRREIDYARKHNKIIRWLEPAALQRHTEGTLSGIPPEQQDCPRCQGTRTINMHNPPTGALAYCPTTCPKCGGTGKVKATKEDKT